MQLLRPDRQKKVHRQAALLLEGNDVRHTVHVVAHHPRIGVLAFQLYPVKIDPRVDRNRQIQKLHLVVVPAEDGLNYQTAQSFATVRLLSYR